MAVGGGRCALMEPDDVARPEGICRRPDRRRMRRRLRPHSGGKCEGRLRNGLTDEEGRATNSAMLPPSGRGLQSMSDEPGIPVGITPNPPLASFRDGLLRIGQP